MHKNIWIYKHLNISELDAQTLRIWKHVLKNRFIVIFFADEQVSLPTGTKTVAGLRPSGELSDYTSRLFSSWLIQDIHRLAKNFGTLFPSEAMLPHRSTNMAVGIWKRVEYCSTNSAFIVLGRWTAINLTCTRHASKRICHPVRRVRTNVREDNKKYLSGMWWVKQGRRMYRGQNKHKKDLKFKSALTGVIMGQYQIINCSI